MSLKKSTVSQNVHLHHDYTKPPTYKDFTSKAYLLPDCQSAILKVVVAGHEVTYFIPREMLAWAQGVADAFNAPVVVPVVEEVA
jgi:hypothetical protein